MAGIALPVGPRKRSVFVVHCRETVGPCPLTIDPTGVWFRPEGAGFICGVSPDEDQDPETWDDGIDYPMFDEIVWPALAARVPAFEALKLTGAWVGHYDYNALDQNAVLGAHPELANFYFANGFSGHGLQQSPGVGRAIAELLVHGAWRSLDLSVFGYERIAAGRPYREESVV
jgi:FAD-dependent oxidoreductase domain-containing protein 1